MLCGKCAEHYTTASCGWKNLILFWILNINALLWYWIFQMRTEYRGVFASLKLQAIWVWQSNSRWNHLNIILQPKFSRALIPIHSTTVDWKGVFWSTICSKQLIIHWYPSLKIFFVSLLIIVWKKSNAIKTFYCTLKLLCSFTHISNINWRN